jgi:hypothetical protein
MFVFRLAVSLFAILMILFGLVWTISPIPFGIVFLTLGTLLLAAAAPGEVRWLRRRLRWFDRLMHGLEKRLPKWIAERLRDSDYEHDEAEIKAEAAKNKARKSAR